MANFNLTGQKIKNTYDQLAQVSASLLVDGLGSPTTISASNIQNFDTEVSKSAAEAGFGAGGGGGVSEAVFTAYTSSNDTKVDALIAATSSYLTSVPSGTVSGSSQVSYSGITDVPSGIVSGAAQLPQIGTNQTNIATLTSATSSYLTSLPSGVVSGSSQIDLGSATGTAANATSASYALTASYAENAGGGGAAFPFTGSAGIEGNLDMNVGGALVISDWTGSLADSSILISQTANATDRVNTAGTNNIQIGHNSRIVESSQRDNVVLIGADAEAAQGTVVIGQSARSLTDSGVAIGRDAESNDNYSVTIGADSTTNGNNAVNIGYNNTVDNNGSIGIGAGLHLSASTNQINIGNTITYDGSDTIRLKSNSFLFNSSGTVSAGRSCINMGIEGGSVTADYSSIFGATYSNLTTSNGVIVGGYSHTLSGGSNNAIIGGGESCQITNGDYSAIFGGSSNTLSGGDTSFILSGYQNQVTGGSRNGVIGGNQAVSAHDFSVLIGMKNFTSTATNTTYVQNLDVSGSISSQAGAVGFTDAVRVDTTTVTISSNTASIDGSATNYFYINNNGGSNLVASPTNLQDGATYTFKVDDGRNITWGDAYKWPNGVVPTFSSGSDIISFVSIGGTNLYGTAQYNFQ